MRFVAEQLLRVTRPGANVCIHIQQLLAYQNQHGFQGRRDFRGAMINVFRAAGFNFYGEAVTPGRPPCEIIIPKDPQAMAQRLNLHSLQFKTGYGRNGCDLAPAVNDYLLIFQKPGEHPCPPRPLIHAERNPGGWVTTDEWVQWASGVWGDVSEFDILDGHRSARESTEEKHICPLQLELIRRCILLYTNPISIQPDVKVLDPFMGIGSTAYVAMGGPSPVTKLKIPEPRNVVGFELKESYYANSLKNVERARSRSGGRDGQMTIADLLNDSGPHGSEDFSYGKNAVPFEVA